MLNGPLLMWTNTAIDLATTIAIKTKALKPVLWKAMFFEPRVYSRSLECLPVSAAVAVNMVNGKKGWFSFPAAGTLTAVHGKNLCLEAAQILDANLPTHFAFSFPIREFAADLAGTLLASLDCALLSAPSARFYARRTPSAIRHPWFTAWAFPFGYHTLPTFAMILTQPCTLLIWVFPCHI